MDKEMRKGKRRKEKRRERMSERRIFKVFEC
jgi:hypothetical protein